MKFKYYERKIKPAFMVCADFESIKVSYTTKYQNNIAYSYDYKLVCVDQISNLGENDVYNFINNMIEERKYCNEVLKNHFNKGLAMTREENENFENSSKCWICDNETIIMLIILLK